jgi:carbamoyltransferase
MKHTEWQNLWIPPAANDAGTALGAALVIWNQVLGHRDRVAYPNAYLGPAFSAAECENALRRSGMGFTRPANLARRVAELLAAGRTVGWFQGRMEFGPRALGHRSILADPSRGEMRTVINQKIKARENFRPFAPSVLAASVPVFFDIPFGYQMKEASPLDFMLAAVSVRNNFATCIPAAVQVNQCTGQASARVHLVSEQSDDGFSELLVAFEQLTGQVAVLNTSFNVSEPIVCRPEHAIAAFQRGRLEALALGPYLVERNS